MSAELIEQLKLAVRALERCEYGAARIRLSRILAVNTIIGKIAP